MMMGASFCPGCGQAVEPDARFCRNCGHALTATGSAPPTISKSYTEQYGPSASPPPPPTPDAESSRLRPLLIIGGFVLLGVAGAVVASGNLGGGGGTAAVPTPTQQQFITPAPRPTFTLTPTEAPPEPTAAPIVLPSSFAKLSDRDWAKVVKTPDSYIGEGYQLWGCVYQFDAATGLDSFLAQASNAKQEYWFSDGVNAAFTGTESQLADIVEDDVVFMSVMSLGSLSYDTQIGGNTTVPLFEIVKIARKGSCK